MAAGASSPAPNVNGTHTSDTPLELSLSLPFNLGTRVHLHLTILATSIVLFVTTAALDTGASGANMGSFVYAISDVMLRYASPLTSDC
jgi:hypothetical protein